MINLVERALRSKIEAINFVGRYGGIIRPVRHRKQVYPVSTYVSEKQCQDSGLYNALVPDDRYSSVAYFEVKRSDPGRLEGPKKSVLSSRIGLRLVCWMNYKKLGIAGTVTADQYAAITMGALKDAINFDLDGVKGKIEVRSMNPIINNAKDVFGSWSYYEKNEHIFFYPYGFFAIDLDMYAMINLNCTDAITDPVETTCIWETV